MISSTATVRGSRRHQLLDAIVNLVATRGLDRASMREVAAAGGVSVATVQYHFRTKDELLVTAFEHVGESMRQRLEKLDRSGSAQDVLRRTMIAWMPFDRDRAVGAKVFLAFAARAAVSPSLATVAERNEAMLRDDLLGTLRIAERNQELAPGVDPQHSARILQGLIDGLVVPLLISTDEQGEREIRTALEDHLGRMFLGGSHESVPTPR